MSERCLTLGCPEVVRIALQDNCSGATVPGATNGAAIGCIRNWTIEPIVEEGETSLFKSDCGGVVVRDKQDDQLIGYTISFETAARSNELEALVTGKTLITDSGTNIGTYAVGASLGCTTTQDDPRFALEIFYKLQKCVSGASHVRVLLPMAQFKVTETDRDGALTFYRYKAETSSALANALGADGGPYGDLPTAVATFLAGRDADEYTTGLDFEETITISGACGAIEVPTPA
jgi:hypothetical protein